MTDEDLIDSGETSDDADSNESLLVSDVVNSKDAERRRLQAEIEAFLAKGGKINEIPPNVVADPPKKPESNYGGQPI